MGWLPENVSSYGGEIDRLLILIFVIVGIWFLIAESVLFYFLIRYRKNKNPKATYASGTTIKALAWILIPAFFVLVCDLAIDFHGAGVWKRIKEQIPTSKKLVHVEGRQFVWNITHDGPDGRLGSDDDLPLVNHLYVPVDTNVRLQIASADVIHSFWLPNLRFKQDAVPGRTIHAWFKATKVGTYPIACAELCGIGHGSMQGWLHVLSDDDYEKWEKKALIEKAEYEEEEE